MSFASKDPMAHIHAPLASHCEAWLMGNREGLTRIYKALEELLARPTEKSTEGSGVECRAVGLFPSDCEGYNLMIVLADEPGH